MTESIEEKLSEVAAVDKPPRPRWLRWLFWTVGLVALGILGGLLAGVYVLWQGEQFKDLDVLEDHEPVLYTRVYDRNGSLIDIISSEQRIILDYDDIPENFVYALVAVEDEYFFDHVGVSLLGIMSALKDYVLTGDMRGASTLTQQYVKNITKDSRFSVSRKLKEQFLAVQLERRYTKQEIFAMYANEVPFGNNQFGLAAAAKFYFGKQPGALSLTECATLAGIPQAPSRFNPLRNPEACRWKRNVVLERMVVEGYITRDVGNAAKALPLELADREKKADGDSAQYFVDKVRQYLFGKYGEERVRTSGWYVHTTLDMNYQRTAQTALQETLREIDKELGYRPWDCPSIFPDAEEENSADERTDEELAIALAEYYDPSWRTPLQDGLNFRGLVTSVDPDFIEVRIDETTFQLGPENMQWIGSRRKDLTKTFQVGDVPLFRAALKEGVTLPGSDSAAPPAADDADEADPSGDGNNSETDADADASDEEQQVNLADYFDLELDQIPDIEGAFIAVDPTTGDLLAEIGGYDYRRSKFNRAEQAQRQVGSAIKPLVFGAALEQGYTLADNLFDEPTIFYDPTQFEVNDRGELELRSINARRDRLIRLGVIDKPEPYEPHNYYRSYVGRVTLRNAMAQSKNIVSVKLLNSVGYDNVLDYALRLKLDSPSLQPFPSLALGAPEITLSDMTYAYGTYGQNGVRYQPRFITYITDSRNNEIENTPPKGEQVLSPENAFLITTALQSVIGDAKGTARRAAPLQNFLGGHLAGKTGTTNDYTNAWFIGYSPNLAAGAWVGRDLNHTIGPNRAGSNTALPVFVKFLDAVKEEFAGPAFNVPEGLVQERIDRYTGKKLTPDCDCDTSDAIMEWFQEGTEPTEICTAAEKGRLDLPWYLQKRTYTYDPETEEIKPSLVEIDVQSQYRARAMLDARQAEAPNN